MAFPLINLKINNVSLELTDDQYNVTFKAVDNKVTSEAGTTLRSVTRTGIRTMSISYTCIETDKILLEGYSKASSLTAKFYDETTSTDIEWRCFMEGYSENLVVEGTSHRYYKVSFKLCDLEN